MNNKIVNKEVKGLFDTLSIGKTAMLLSMASDSDEKEIRDKAEAYGYKVFKGHVGAMDSSKIFAAIETAAKREKFIKNIYREEHSLYHAVLEAYEGICRGQTGLGNVMRTAGLVFTIVKGSRIPRDNEDGQWIAIVLYGNMGAPVKGYEHEVMGLGIYPV
ncbi:hut operon transcriptional regulator HutP [Clostridium felsineum]|uniref:Hut operon positive regulatory protein n=1 Tax=Clostridium felsineum TaxID=36839 RepID=A0A1S8MCG4_9CLOT|nr:HutP family protein [Clostridium felsineum]MCR3759602.1 hut operon transcriptional regulator HutP [Clostridium felsineum]URZ04986.1 Hut operon positive regulatory protein [Clostridium felsineum]URZ10027.1 Hut operon positive regulatory protein [Clostridium felsineum]URZ18075.1 Hut operon positive regulatory protein [Clostridium felsineum DSM 794]